MCLRVVVYTLKKEIFFKASELFQPIAVFYGFCGKFSNKLQKEKIIINSIGSTRVAKSELTFSARLDRRSSGAAEEKLNWQGGEELEGDSSDGALTKFQ